MSWRPGFNSGLKALSLGLWGVVLVQSGASGRLDLLLRAVFHPLVWISGGLLLALAVLELVSGQEAPLPRRQRLGFLAGCLAALAVLLLPPVPSFADLAANRSQDFQPGPALISLCHRANAASPSGCACCAANRTPSCTRAIRSRSAASCYPCRVIAPSWRACWCAVAWSMRCRWACPCSGLLINPPPKPICGWRLKG